MKKSKMTALIIITALFVFSISSFGFIKFSGYYVPFSLFPSEWLVNTGHNNVDKNIRIARLMFNNCHWLRIPAIKSYIWNKNIPDAEKYSVVVFLPYLQDQTLHSDVRGILKELLQSEDYQQRISAVMAMRFMDASVVPDLVDAWLRKDERGIKMGISQAMLQIGDKSVIPILDKDVGKNDYEDVFASIVLYQMTKEMKYKSRILEILKSGSRDQRGFAIVFIGGMDAQMVPFLRQAAKDRDTKLRKVANENLNKLLHPDAKEKSFLEVLKRSPSFKDAKVGVKWD